MNATQRKLELAALWSLAVIVILGSIFVGYMVTGKEEGQTPGIIIGGLMAALPMLINAIRNIGQSQAMQEMASQLGQSVPVSDSSVPQAVTVVNTTDDPVPTTEGNAP